MYAPFTESGTIVVNGIVASIFVAFQNSSHVTLGDGLELPISFQWMAHAFESFHRLVWRVVGGRGYWSLETYTSNGVSHWVAIPHRFAEWLWVQHPVVIVGTMLPVLTVLGAMYVLERFTLVVSILVVVMAAAWAWKQKKPRIA